MTSSGEKPVFDSGNMKNPSPFSAEGSGSLESELHATRDGTHHNSNLFDENEDRAGEKVDLATGKAIDNSTDFGLRGLRVHDKLPENGEDEDKDSPGAQWLRDRGL